MKAFIWTLLLGVAAQLAARAQSVITPTHQIELFNGRDFSGFTFCQKGDPDIQRTWSVTNGVIHCTGKPTGYLRTVQSYSNYVLTVEWRFVKLAPKADNTGILLHIQSPDTVWPRCVQVQGKHEHMGDVFLMAGAESKEHQGLDANTPLPMRGPPNENPVGSWNTISVVCSNDIVRASVNGKWLNETTQCTVTGGFIGMQSEGAEFEIRKLLLGPLPQ